MKDDRNRLLTGHPLGPAQPPSRELLSRELLSVHEPCGFATNHENARLGYGLESMDYRYFRGSRDRRGAVGASGGR